MLKPFKTNFLYIMTFLKTFAALLFTGFSAGLFAQSKMTVTAKGGLVLRQEANEKSAKVTTIPEGKEVEASEPVTKTKETLNGKQGNWRKCTFQGKTGYVFDAFLKEVDPSAFASGTSESWYVTSNAGLIMRKSASQKAEKIQTIPFGTELKSGDVGEAEGEETINGIQGNWRNVRYKGKEGYVFDGYLGDKPAKPANKK